MILSFDKRSTITAAQAQALICGDDWCMQQKYDGERLQVRCRDGQIRQLNRHGKEVNVLGPLAFAFRCDVGDYWLDGELAWGRYYPFDEVSNPRAPYRDRLTRAAQLVQAFDNPDIRQVRTWRSTARKALAFKRAASQGIEGVVFRHLGEYAIASA